MSPINWTDERNTFYAALMFYTRLPVPGSYRHNENYVSQAAKYLPVIGCVVGALSAGVFLAAEAVLSAPTATLASIITSVLVTGALHEDGFADVCDGFGAGADRERILQIMADSCLGSYGTIGLILLLGFKFSLMATIADQGSALLAGSIIAAHTLSRFFAFGQMQRQRYARRAGQGKSTSAVRRVLLARRLATCGVVSRGEFVAASAWNDTPAALECGPDRAFVGKVLPRAHRWLYRRLPGRHPTVS